MVNNNPCLTCPLPRCVEEFERTSPEYQETAHLCPLTRHPEQSPFLRLRERLGLSVFQCAQLWGQYPSGVYNWNGNWRDIPRKIQTLIALVEAHPAPLETMLAATEKRADYFLKSWADYLALNLDSKNERIRFAHFWGLTPAELNTWLDPEPPPAIYLTFQSLGANRSSTWRTLNGLHETLPRAWERAA